MRELRTIGVSLTETVPGPGGGEEVRPEALPPLVAELRKNRQANVPAGRLVNEAVAIIRLLRSRPPSVAASVGLVGLYVAVCALTIAGMLTVLHLSAGDVWNLVEGAVPPPINGHFVPRTDVPPERGESFPALT